MATAKRIEANQANAQSSTGPRTEQGKSVSSRNALTHGLTAKTVLLPGEDSAEYQAISDGMLKDLDPLNTTEAVLAQELVDLTWRLRRASSFEARILSVDIPDLKALNNMSLHAGRLRRQFSASLKEFELMHDANLRVRNKQLEQAATIHEADQILERPSSLEELGFDFTVDFLERWMARREAPGNAWEVIKEDQLRQAYNTGGTDDNDGDQDQDQAA